MELEEKYIQGNITSEELCEFRRWINNTGDEELVARMDVRWRESATDTSGVPEEHLESLHARILERIRQNTGNGLWHTAWRYLQIAAVFLLPFLFGAAYYLYRENAALQDESIVVATGVGEQATVILPDGTCVTLNEESTLSYDARSYSGAQRNLLFVGEGWFDVVKKPEKPFSIHAEGLKVCVLGTKFNLLARSSQNQSELTLDEGRVILKSLVSGNEVTLLPAQKALLDKLTGKIQVQNAVTTLSDVTAWKRKELVFRNAPLSSVIAILEKNYHVRFESSFPLSDDRFTGTMPANDINEDLEILEKSYHVVMILVDDKVEIVSR